MEVEEEVSEEDDKIEFTNPADVFNKNKKPVKSILKTKKTKVVEVDE